MKVKKSMFISFLAIFFFCTNAITAYANSPVWKITKGNQHLFIGGTIHLLGKADYPLPQSFHQAYQQAVKIVLETDIQKIQSPEFAQTLVAQVMYPPGQNLQRILKPETFQALEKHLNSRGIPIASLMQLKVGMVVVTLSTIELQRMGLAGMGVDGFFNAQARVDKKSMGQLETPEQQVAFIAEMGTGLENEIIEHTLRDLKSLPNLLKVLKRAWRHGDIEKLNEVGILPFKRDYPEVYQALLVKRNKIWLPQIEALLKSKEIELVLVGALHLVGDEGILQLLQKNGYQIEKL